MNWDRIEGNWKQFKGNVKQQWGKLTDDELDVIAGRRDQLFGKIQEAYGISMEEAEQQLSAWQERQNEMYRPPTSASAEANASGHASIPDSPRKGKGSSKAAGVASRSRKANQGAVK